MANGWLVPRHELDEDQKEFLDKVYDKGGNRWISGFAGSGKSVLLCYAIEKAQKENRSFYIVTFTRSLIEMFKAAMASIGLSVSGCIGTIYDFKKRGGTYDYVFCDEVQDLSRESIEEMRNRSNVLYVAGDANQSIYDKDPRSGEPTVCRVKDAPSRCGHGFFILPAPAFNREEIASASGAEEFRLSFVHRLSSRLRKASESLLGTTLFEETKDASRKDTQIRFKSCSCEEEEIKYIWNEAKKFAGVGQSSCILVHKLETAVSVANMILRQEGKAACEVANNNWGKPDFGSLNAHCDRNGVQLRCVGNRYGSFSESYHGVYLMTYHSSKGLDFENVFIPFVNNDLRCDKTVFFVAITRSRNNLFITYSGTRHNFLDSFPRDTWVEVTAPQSGNSSGGFSW